MVSRWSSKLIKVRLVLADWTISTQIKLTMPNNLITGTSLSDLLECKNTIKFHLHIGFLGMDWFLFY